MTPTHPLQIQLLRRKSTVTARELSENLEVSERTIYRDIRDLAASGVPIEGEAGVGYVLKSGFDLPPLMFKESEIEALVLGARIVESWADAELADSATDAIAKIEELYGKQGDFGAFLQVAHNWADFEQTKRSYELFARYVMPRFSGANANREASFDWAAAHGQEFGTRSAKAQRQMIEKHEAEQKAKTGKHKAAE